MPQTEAWIKELATVAVVAMWLVLFGLWVGQMPRWLAAGSAVYLMWHMFQLYRLTYWLSNPGRYPRPYAVGLWVSILHSVNDLHTRSKKRKHKLARILSKFHESTSALPDATVVLDGDGSIDWWNQAAAEVLGLNRRQEGVRAIREVIPDPVFQSYIASGDYSRPIKIPAPVNDNISLEIRIVPYGKGKLLLQGRDITRLQQLETVRRDFVANVSHEMRTPLTVIHGYLETMGDSDDAGLSNWDGIVAQMLQQTVRLQRIVQDLLMLARLDASENAEVCQPVNVTALLEILIDEAESLSGDQQHKFILESDNGLQLIGSESELESAFSNLIFNAVRYTPAGGEITLTWGTNNEEGGACFGVEDTGIGIEQEHIPRLTERFYRVDVGRSRKSGGTGLGLAIVKHVMTRHSGYLKINSKPGMGSLFRCCFPGSRIVR
ncbi:MAG: phosphate regulon sensor histidine kinase PhoR [Gammaproteobacteria bacterium]|nr:phosphate regulon sensor histidine kinase PhoR [Gammaproteobacteria bacterium]